jgi:hypothetical protein
VEPAAGSGSILDAKKHPGYLAEGVLLVVCYAEEDGDPLAEVGIAELDVLSYSPRSSEGAKGLSDAPPEAAGFWTKNWEFFSMYSFHSAGTLSPGKIASTGQAGRHASQSTHSSGWM